MNEVFSVHDLSCVFRQFVWFKTYNCKCLVSRVIRIGKQTCFHDITWTDSQLFQFGRTFLHHSILRMLHSSTVFLKHIVFANIRFIHLSCFSTYFTNGMLTMFASQWRLHGFKFVSGWLQFHQVLSSFLYIQHIVFLVSHWYNFLVSRAAHQRKPWHLFHEHYIVLWWFPIEPSFGHRSCLPMCIPSSLISKTYCLFTSYWYMFPFNRIFHQWTRILW